MGLNMDKITLNQYEDMVRDVDTPEIDIVYYSIIIEGEGGFDFHIAPDPEKVDIPEGISTESALTWANNWDRRRRKKKFYRRLDEGADLPILVSEGDSWYQYPLMITDVIDHLKHYYLIYSVGAAGDTLRNMVGPDLETRKNEYMIALRRMRDEGRTVSGFLFSGAGNDIIGNDPDTKRPVLEQLLNPFNGDVNDIDGHINQIKKNEKLQSIKAAYETVITTIRGEAGFENLPIFIHGYDYVFPFPAHGEGPGKGFNKRKRKWLGHPLDKAEIYDTDLRRNIIRSMLNELHRDMESLTLNHNNVHHIDCRDAMPHVSDWNDEIHGTSAGFSKVATRFRQKVDGVLYGSPLVG